MYKHHVWDAPLAESVPAQTGASTYETATGLGTMVLLQAGLGIMGLTFLVSLFCVPLIASFLVELLGEFNDSKKEI